MVTSIEEIKKNQAVEIDLPGWGIEDVFICKLKRVNLLNLISKGTIPNPLTGVIVGLFKGKGVGSENEENFKALNEISEFFCEQCLVKPSFKELKENDIELTDDQKMIIYNFALEGPKVLIPFSRKSEDTSTCEYGENVQQNTERDSKDK